MTMTLEEIRKTIDTLDPKIRDLLLQRMDCSHKVAEVKQQDGSTTVFRADREQKILDTLGKEVPPERRAAYLAVVRKIMEASRMYQYGLLFDWNPGILAPLLQGFSMERGAKNVTVQFACSDCPNGLGKLLSMIGDYDVNLETLTQLSKNTADSTVTFQVTLQCDPSESWIQQLLFQLSKESQAFKVVKIEEPAI